MPGIDLTTALGRLLSDAALRRDYAADARALARRLDVDAAHLDGFLALDRDGLEIQAEALIGKRYHEAALLMPESGARLGDRGRALFVAFAETAWPTGHRRHLEDAVRFCEFLARRGEPAVSRSELNRLRFAFGDRPLALHFVARHPRRGRYRPALQLLRRRRDGSLRQYVVFLF